MLSEGQVVRHIRLLSRLGAGAMGEVWEGCDEVLGRRVAVKAIRRSHDTDPLARARFAREASLLSQLEHPNVCRLYEYLETDGCDLVVLELLRGRDLGQVIRDGLEPSERLSVALGVCSALLAAHSLSIVHRDLKPENVMLTEAGTVKVLDFGIARRVADGAEPAAEAVASVAGSGSGDPGVTGSTTIGRDSGSDGPVATGLETGSADIRLRPDSLAALTVDGQLVGTPRYMSPEQARGEGATAASDMFCFGLLLFEVYTSKPAYLEGNLAATLAQAQGASVPRPRGVDRAVAALIRDLTAPDVQARPTAAQALERLGRLQRRPLRRLLVAAAAVAVTSLLVGTALSLLGLARARREAAVAQATTDFLVGLFEAVDPRHAPDPDVRAREVLDRGAERLREELTGDPATRARLLTTLGKIRGDLGLYRDAQSLLEEALAVQERLSGRDSPELVAPMLALAHALVGQGAHGRADELLRHAAAIAARAGLAREVAAAHTQLAASLAAQGRLDEAEAAARASLAAWQRALGPDHPKTAAATVNAAVLEVERGHYAVAEPMLAAALAVLERALPEEHPDVAAAVNNLATARKELGRLAEAEALYRRSLATLEKRLGASHPQCAVVQNDLAVVLFEQRRYPEAEAAYREAVATAARALGDAHPLTAIFTANLAEACLLQGRAAEAEPLYRAALAAVRPALGETHPAVAECLRGLGRTCAALGRPAEAERLLLESLAVREQASGAEHAEVGKTLAVLGVFYLDQERPADAAPCLERARAILERSLPADHPALAELHTTLGRLGSSGTPSPLTRGEQGSPR